MKINKILDYIFIILIILEGTSVYANSSILPIGVFSLLTLYLPVYFIFNCKKKYSKNKIFFLMIYYIYMLIYCIMSVSTSNLMNYLIKFYGIFTVCYLSIDSKERLIDLLYKYRNVIIILSCFSLIFYVGYVFLDIIPITNQVLLKWGNPTYVSSILNLHFFVQTESVFGISVIRNTGIFCEAPMYALHLIFAYAIELFLNKKISKFNLIILIITALSTFSSSVYIFIIIISLLKFSNFKLTKKNSIKVLLVLIFLIVGAFGINKIIVNKSTSRSYSVRTDDYMASFKSWQENIIFGNGYRNTSVFKSYISSFRSTNTGQSSSFGTILSQGGIYLFILYAGSIVICYSFLKKQGGNCKFLAFVYGLMLALLVFPYTALEIVILSISLNLLNLKDIQEISPKTKKETWIK